MQKLQSAKRNLIAIAVATVLGINGITPAYAAGIPTTDPVADVQRAMQHAASIAKYVEQLAALKAQLDTARAQLQSFTGTRNLGDIWNDPEIRKALPKDAQEILKSAEETYGSMSRSVKRIKSEEQLSGVYISDREKLEDREWDFLTAAKAALENIDYATAARKRQLEKLQAEINKTTDPKSISELQARMLVEQANVAADQMHVDSLQRQLEREAALIEKQKAKLAESAFSVDAIRAPLPGAR
ncbi:type IV secretion system protein [Achromobacter denitrificans]